MAATIQNVTVVDRPADNVAVVRITLSNGLFEDFIVTLNGNVETWSTLDGDEVASFNRLTGTSADAIDLAHALVNTIDSDAVQMLTDLGMPGNLSKLTPEQLAEKVREADLDMRLGIPLGEGLPTEAELTDEMTAELTGGFFDPSLVNPQLLALLAEASAAGLVYEPAAKAILEDLARQAAENAAAEAKAIEDAEGEAAAAAAASFNDQAGQGAALAAALAFEFIYLQAYEAALLSGMTEEEARAVAEQAVAAAKAEAEGDGSDDEDDG